MTQIGFSASAQGECNQFLGVTQLDIQVAYLRYLNFSWTDGMLSPSWLLDCKNARTAMLSVPMLVGPQNGTPLPGSGSGQTLSPQNYLNENIPTTMTLTDVAGGVWDTMFSQIFATTASIRPDCILRIGWEQYGNGWYPWNGFSLYSQYSAAYRHLVTLARSYSSSFRFDWNGNVAFASFDPTLAYPGDAYVDYMTTDVYDSFVPGGSAGWIAYQSAVLTNALNYAISRGKPFGLPEFGLFYLGFAGGYGDDPSWIQEAYNWISLNQANIAYACYFQNYAGDPTTDGGGALQRNPLSAHVFSNTFGQWAQDNAAIYNYETSWVPLGAAPGRDNTRLVPRI